MKDALSAGEYVVTLTPADEDEDPSSVTFEAITANKVERIEILGDYLVMKDTDFDEGYCFIKGYNHFNEPVTLSGLTVNAAPSSSTQYDSSTGKLTVKSDTANQYAIIKQVTVYAQAMVDSKAIVAQKTLEVSSIGYPAEVEFGEITKDATNAPDISDGITINDLNSGLYYIPILSVKDNYGNDMLAKDLNDLNVANLLTTVPTNDNSLYFSVRTKGSVFTEKNGQVVVFLGAGNGKPGTFNFLMTSAGGQFEKEVNIIENPFIDTLNVTLPDIYEYEETDEFGLVGYDQDGKELDLYDYLQAGEYPDGKLTFIDKKNLTESQTSIDAGDNGTWRVQKFADTKTYKVTFVPDEDVKAKGIITFVVTTASFNTDTKMATVGARGTSGNISPELTKAATVGLDFNQALQFLDANGKKMDRAHNAKYPLFVQTNGTKVTASLAKADVAAMTDEKIAEANHDGDAANDFKFYYVVSKEDKDTSVKDQESVTQGTNAPSGVATTAGQYYVFLIASQNLANPAKTRIIDSRSFYVSNAQVGDVPVSYTAKVSNKLYTGDQYDKPVEVEVDVTFRNGVVRKDVVASGLALDGGFKVVGNKISKGTVKGDGSATVSVYLAEIYGDRDGDGVTDVADPYTNDGAVATCTLTYADDDPVGTSVDFKRTTTSAAVPLYGTIWSENETETVWDLKEGVTSEITVEDGVLTMTKGNVANDTYKMTVKDQYGIPMENAKYYINGTQVPTTQTTFVDNATQKVLEIKGQSKGSEVSKTWRVNVPEKTIVKAQDITTTVSVTNITASTTADLNSALALATADTAQNYVITVPNAVTSAGEITVPANTTLNVTSDGTLSVTGALIVTGDMNVDGTLLTADKTVTINGDLVLNGRWIHTGDATTGDITVGNTGSVTGTGHFKKTGAANKTINGTWEIEGDTTELAGATTVSGTGTFGGNVVVAGTGVTLTFGATATKISANIVVEDSNTLTLNTANILQDGAVIDLSEGGAINAVNGIKIAGEATVKIITASDKETEFTSKSPEGTDDAALNISAGGAAVAADPEKVTTNVTEKPSMAPITTIVTAADAPAAAKSAGYDKDYEASKGSLSVALTETNYDVKNKKDSGSSASEGAKNTTATVEYQYTVSGSTPYIESFTPGFYGAAYHYMFALLCPTAKASGAKEVYIGDNCTEGSTKAVNGWINATGDNDGDFSKGWKTAPTSSDHFTVRYVFDDGTVIDHVFNFTAANFGAVPTTDDKD